MYFSETIVEPVQYSSNVTVETEIKSNSHEKNCGSSSILLELSTHCSSEYDYCPEGIRVSHIDNSIDSDPTNEIFSNKMTETKADILNSIINPLTIHYDASCNIFRLEYTDALLSAPSIVKEITATEWNLTLENFSNDYKSYFITPIKIFKMLQLSLISIEACLFICIILTPLFVFFYDVEVGYISLIVCFVAFAILFTIVLSFELVIMYLLQKLIVRRAIWLMENKIEKQNNSMKPRNLVWTISLKSSSVWSRNTMYLSPTLKLSKQQ